MSKNEASQQTQTDEFRLHTIAEARTKIDAALEQWTTAQEHLHECFQLVERGDVRGWSQEAYDAAMEELMNAISAFVAAETHLRKLEERPQDYE